MASIMSLVASFKALSSSTLASWRARHLDWDTFRISLSLEGTSCSSFCTPASQVIGRIDFRELQRPTTNTSISTSATTKPKPESPSFSIGVSSSAKHWSSSLLAKHGKELITSHHSNQTKTFGLRHSVTYFNGAATWLAAYSYFTASKDRTMYTFSGISKVSGTSTFVEASAFGISYSSSGTSSYSMTSFWEELGFLVGFFGTGFRAVLSAKLSCNSILLFFLAAT